MRAHLVEHGVEPRDLLGRVRVLRFVGHGEVRECAGEPAVRDARRPGSARSSASAGRHPTRCMPVSIFKWTSSGAVHRSPRPPWRAHRSRSRCTRPGSDAAARPCRRRPVPAPTARARARRCPASRSSTPSSTRATPERRDARGQRGPTHRDRAVAVRVGLHDREQRRPVRRPFAAPRTFSAIAARSTSAQTGRCAVTRRSRRPGDEPDDVAARDDADQHAVRRRRPGRARARCSFISVARSSRVSSGPIVRGSSSITSPTGRARDLVQLLFEVRHLARQRDRHAEDAQVRRDVHARLRDDEVRVLEEADQRDQLRRPPASRRTCGRPVRRPRRRPTARDAASPPTVS